MNTVAAVHAAVSPAPVPVVALGVVAGVGMLIAGHGVFPRTPTLARTIHQLHRPGASVADQQSRELSNRQSRIRRRTTDALVGRLGSRVCRDLAAAGRDAESFAMSKLATGLALAGVVVAFGVLLRMGGAGLAPGLTALFTLVAAVIGFTTPDLTLRANARNRREAFRQALSSYLDLVNVVIAGGAGIETALEAAAQAGDGPSFALIRNNLLRAHTLRQSPWGTLEELGERIGVVELTDIAASIRLAGEQGARVKASLAAKAVSLRGRQMARVEAAAHSATERMGLPTVVMFLGFMVFLGYPAMQQIVGAL